MTMLKKVLTTISYVGVAGAPVLASTGVGLLWGGALGALGLTAGAWLHFLDSPRTPADVLAAAKASIELAKQVEAAKKG